MQLSISSLPLPVRLRSAVPLTNDEFLLFCRARKPLNVERQSLGEIVIVTPTGGENNRRQLFVATELLHWAKGDGRGVSYSSSARLILAAGATLSPDAAWVPLERWEAVTPDEREDFLPFCPAFVIEVLSQSDARLSARAEMQQWIANGAELGWLFNPYRKALSIYSRGMAEAPKFLQEPSSVEAGEPVAGLRLTLKRIWA